MFFPVPGTLSPLIYLLNSSFKSQFQHNLPDQSLHYSLRQSGMHLPLPDMKHSSSIAPIHSTTTFAFPPKRHGTLWDYNDSKQNTSSLSSKNSLLVRMQTSNELQPNVAAPWCGQVQNTSLPHLMGHYDLEEGGREERRWPEIWEKEKRKRRELQEKEQPVVHFRESLERPQELPYWCAGALTIGTMLQRRLKR